MAERVLAYGRQSIDEDDIAAVVAQLRDDWLTQGPTVAKFESTLCELTGAKYAIAVANGTAALHLACLAARLGADDVALVPDITFAATANAVRYCNARPVLMDVHPESALLRVDLAEEEVARRAKAGAPPKAILPVSLAGSPPDLARVRALADTVGAVVIEDAAHSLGATYVASGKTFVSASCSHSDMAILSFHPVKHLTTGEGGAITTNDARLDQALRDLRSHGITKDPTRLEANDGPWYQEQQTLGFNYRLTDIQSALGVSQAKKFPRFLARRRALAALYDSKLVAMSTDLVRLQVPAGVTSAYHLYVVRLVGRASEGLEEIAARRKALFLHLRERGIIPQVHYVPVHRQPSYRSAGFAEGTFTGADAYYAGALSLPMFPGMADEDVDRVIRGLESFFRG